MSRNKYRAIVVSVAILFVAVCWAAAYIKREPAAAPSADYTVARISRGDIVEAVNTTGLLMPSVTVEVSTQISGLVSEVNVDFNSPVTKGQVLARIDPATFEQKMRQASADLAAAEASNSLALLTTNRLTGLREQDLVAQDEFDRAQAQLKQSRANLLTRKAALENAHVDFERCTIASPIDGVVIYKQVEVGKTVVSSFSAPTLFVIAQDLTKMRIIAPISEVDVRAVRPGQPVTFTVDAIPDRSFTGQLTQVRSPYTPSEKQQQQSAQQSSITNFDGVIDVENPGLILMPNLTANVSVVVAKSVNALRVANGALRVSIPDTVQERTNREPASSDSAVVYRLAGGNRATRPEPVVVRIGITDNVNTEVLEGLREGDTVITGFARPIEIPKRQGPF